MLTYTRSTPEGRLLPLGKCLGDYSVHHNHHSAITKSTGLKGEDNKRFYCSWMDKYYKCDSIRKTLERQKNPKTLRIKHNIYVDNDII